MIPGIENFAVNENLSLESAISKIDMNANGICFVLNDNGKLLGILTDGDIRRAILKGSTLRTLIKDVMNTNFISLSFTSSPEVIKARLSDKIRNIPLVDENNILVDYASRFRSKQIPIMQPSLSGNELNYVTDCISTGWISSQGKYVREFEASFAKLCNMPYALATSNGTVALHLALVAKGIGPGDEVIVPDFTFAATINAVLYTGATPVIADVDLASWTIDIASLKKSITAKTKAIIPVHIYGHPCDMDAICQLALEYNLVIIEDCAESVGSAYRSQPTGSFGDVAAFSFFGNKTITTGEGGMLVFKDKDTYERASVLRDHGMNKTKKYWHDILGFNYRMTNLQAAIGVAQLERIEDIVEKKISLARKYNKALEELPGIKTQGQREKTVNTYWLYTLIILPESGFTRDLLAEKLAKNGIETRPAFYPLHAMPLYSAYKTEHPLDNSQFISNHGLSLPSFADMSDEEINFVIQAVKRILNNK